MREFRWDTSVYIPLDTDRLNMGTCNNESLAQPIHEQSWDSLADVA